MAEEKLKILQKLVVAEEHTPEELEEIVEKISPFIQIESKSGNVIIKNIYPVTISERVILFLIGMYISKELGLNDSGVNSRYISDSLNIPQTSLSGSLGIFCRNNIISNENGIYAIKFYKIMEQINILFKKYIDKKSIEPKLKNKTEPRLKKQIKKSNKIEKTQKFGEIDAHVNYTFSKNGKKIFNIQFSLLHNGFSRRSWVNVRDDLYKGNGRVRHEYYSIHQGPFQSIKYESYQSDQINNDTLKGSGQCGGELHSDVLIFRNSKAIGVDLPPMEQIQFGTVNDNGLQGYSRGHQEDARGECFKEFMMAVKGEIPKGKLKSNIDAHKGSVLLMALAYLSASKSFNDKNPIAQYYNNNID